MTVSLPGGDCNRPNWRKPARSVNGGNCAEVASAAGFVAVRDSKDPDTLVLHYAAGSWNLFLKATRMGHFDEIG
jgi:hypothetical protein